MSGPEGWRTWREATEQALYGPDGFYVRAGGPGPAGHFRTSVHASPLYARAIATLLRRVDAALDHPAELTLVDIGAGRGELLAGVLAALDDLAEHGLDDVAERGLDERGLGARVRPCAVERAARPDGLDPRIGWVHDLDELPGTGSLTGLVFANEWLDNVPVDIAETDVDGVPRRVLVRQDGEERLGEPVTGPDAEWLERWWPLSGRGPADEYEAGAGGTAVAAGGLRAEIGRPRDEAWRRAVRTLGRGLAVTADYAHDRATRPPYGTLTGFRDGREVRPVPDGSCDITAHVALDSCAAYATGPTEAAEAVVVSQRVALRALGIDGRRPPLALASSDPAAYVRALSSAGEAAELTDPGGLGAFHWLVQPVGLSAGPVRLVS